MRPMSPFRLSRLVFYWMVAVCWLIAPRSAHSDGDTATLVVTAKLVEIPSKLPPDDLYDYAYVMRYQVQGGPLDKQFILVAHYKPLQPRSKIKDKMKSQVGCLLYTSPSPRDS